MNEDLEFLTVAEVAKNLQIHWQTVLNYIKSKKLKAVKIGNGYRISKSDFLEFIDKYSTDKK
jgi:excisionase family DNA binding protein